jgi:hypothetical protein
MHAATSASGESASWDDRSDRWDGGVVAERARIGHSGRVDPLGLLVSIGVPLGVYFAPTTVAVARKVPNIGAVAIVNTFVGWTVIGWVVALVMATRPAGAAIAQGDSFRDASKASGWYPDPALRHEFRYFDGMTWWSAS